MDMLPEAEERAAKLAVSRFGAEASTVETLYRRTRAAQTQGQAGDFLDTLVEHKVLTPVQAEDLRFGLDVTHIEEKPRANGKAEAVAPLDWSPSSLRQLGEYRILRQLGEGGMGSVLLGYNEISGNVAIKVLPGIHASNQAAVDRFYREAKSGALLNHVNIVRVMGVGKDQATDILYMVMEYVEGCSAHDLLQRFGKLTVGDAVHICLDVARALEHAHSRNVIHRDIKPDNIVITKSGVGKLTDLGLAKRTDETSHLTAAKVGFGTPYYMPYEQAVNAKRADGRSDIYALGATLYHLVTGEVPFPGKNPLEIVEKKELGVFPPASSHNRLVPPVLDAILERMMAREPADRYQTASELIVDLERSALAAPVPSFVDADLALQDPVVRERLTAHAQPTAPDLHLHPKEQLSEPKRTQPNVWYLRYHDKNGRLCKAKATTEQILRRLQEHRFPREVEASHHHSGDFQPLDGLPEFQAAIADSEAKPMKTRPSTNGQLAFNGDGAASAVGAHAESRWLKWGIAAICVAAGLVCLVGLGAFLLGL
jgi:eukaryotic-like serine/threonine-protein kinase